MIMRILLFCLLLSSGLFASKIEPKEEVLWRSLDPASLQQKLLFYSLFPISSHTDAHLPTRSTTLKWAAVFTRETPKPLPLFTEEELQEIEPLHAHLPHRRLLGHLVEKEEEIDPLSSEEVDIARALLLGEYPHDLLTVRSYELLLDTLAEETLRHLPQEASSSQKIDALNQLLFEKEAFCFPPNAVFTKAIDRYTHLSSVLDQKKGVCLGISVLYLCLAQRIGLMLEVVTPPGHIYLRCGARNIETTARGFHVPSEHYLSPNTCGLHMRSFKEVLGLVWVNQASVCLQNRHYQQAITYYEKAKKYLSDDPFVAELLGFALVLAGRKEEGRAVLSRISPAPPPHLLCSSTLIQEYLEAHVDETGIALLFEEPPKDRSGWLERKTSFEKLLLQFPLFTTGWRCLADAWSHLHRPKEALFALEQARKLHAKDPETLFTLTHLYASKRDFVKAWDSFHELQHLLQPSQHFQRELFQLKKSLLIHFAEPVIPIQAGYQAPC